MKRKIAGFLFLLIIVGVYFLFYHKDKTLKLVPKNADVVVLIDVKKLANQSVMSFAMHPSEWFNGAKTNNYLSSFKNSGIKIPDYIQIFHLKNTKLLEFYTILEIKDQQNFLTFLKKQKFINEGNSFFRKDQLYIKLLEGKCIIGNSPFAFAELAKMEKKNKNLQADDFITHSVASVSYLSPENIQNFAVDLLEDEIQIKNTSETTFFTKIIHQLNTNNHFLDLELDQKNSKIFMQIFNKNIIDSAEIQGVKSIVDLQEVNDTIITYGYDDNFNEIEKKTFQKMIQPNYFITFQSVQAEKTWEYFKSKKWINAENQFTAIPFQPNLISRHQNKILVKSTRSPFLVDKAQNKNYIFFKNNALTASVLKNLNPFEMKMFSQLESVFYGNKDGAYYVKIKFKKDKFSAFF